MKKDALRKLFSNKGFYILLAMTFVVVGVAGYVANVKNQTAKMEEISKLPVTIPPIRDYSGNTSVLPSIKPAATPVPTEAPKPSVVPNAVAVAVESDEPPKIILPLEGEMIAGFSGDELVYNKTMGDWRVHEGVDIRSDVGSQVKAVEDGVVKSVYSDSLMGNTIVISHNGGYESTYSGLQSTGVVQEGEAVKRGQVIGGVGVTAEAEIAEPPHLHFEFSKDGVKLDPFKFMN